MTKLKLFLKQVRVSCIVFHSIVLSCIMWQVPCANEQRETSNMAGNWPRQWLPLDLFSVTHPGLADLSKLISANNQLHTLIMRVIREICKVPTLQLKVLNKQYDTQNVHRDGKCYQQFNKKLTEYRHQKGFKHNCERTETEQERETANSL